MIEDCEKFHGWYTPYSLAEVNLGMLWPRRRQLVCVMGTAGNSFFLLFFYFAETGMTIKYPTFCSN
jgi:hypothetical protein